MKGFAILTLSLLLVGKAAATWPMAVSVSPLQASGNAQVFTATYSDDSGASVLNRRLFLINSVLSGSGACFVQADPTGIYLVNDNDSSLFGALTGNGTYSNSQGTLNGSGTLTVSVTFNSAYAGAKNIYMYTEDASGNSNWLFLGTFTVTSPATPMLAGILQLIPALRAADLASFDNKAPSFVKSVIAWSKGTLEFPPDFTSPGKISGPNISDKATWNQIAPAARDALLAGLPRILTSRIGTCSYTHFAFRPQTGRRSILQGEHYARLGLRAGLAKSVSTKRNIV